MTLKRFWISFLCVLCFIPTILLATGKLTIQRAGGMSTMGVIIGPIVGLDDMVNIGTGYEADYSSSNLSKDTPYSNGALRGYKNLGVYNQKRDSASWNGFKYASFCRYFKVVRTDGRLIYDDDGILDIGWNRSNIGTDEIINYPCYFYALETDLPIKANAGFLWTDQQAKFKNTKYNFSMDTNSSTITCLATGISSKPSDSSRTCSTIINENGQIVTNGATCLAIWLTGTGQYENTFWGNTGGDVGINENLTGYMQLANQNWSNSISAVNAKTGTYKGKTAYFAPKTFTVITSNLNNYIKLNGVQATSKYGTSVVPFKDGHHIEISSEEFMLVEYENGAENQYSGVYCLVDTVLPDVSYVYHNANGQDTRKVGTITTNANGAKTQTINEGVFRDQVQVNFSYDENTESPETATYTFNGQTYALTSGQWFNEEGDYTVAVTDLAGNTTISKFTIDKTAPSYNLERLQNDTTYKVAKWYLVDIPYGYNGFGTYSFKEYADAKSFAVQMERENQVTPYYLSNVDNFTQTHLVAPNNTVKVGEYWYYKSRNNPNLYVYYFDRNSLDEVIEYYAKEYISVEQVYRQNSDLTPNNYGNTIDKTVCDNVINVNGIQAYFANEFIFKQQSTNESYKLYYSYQNGQEDKWNEFRYNIAFKNQVTTHGLYKIKEVDYVGHETFYYVYVDYVAPIIDYEAKVYGKDKTIYQTISQNDIPKNGELIFYYEKFAITQVVEDDKWWTAEIKCPDGTIKRYTYLDQIPNLEDLGSGEFTISVADRSNSAFKFKVCILGAAPEVKFENINANTQLKITIVNKDSANALTDLKIYRNDICLNSDTGYDEYPTEDSDDLIYISIDKLNYVFNRGGIYVVEIMDSYGRTLSYEYKFEKDLPTGVLTGVEHNGKTKDEVQFTYNSNKYFAIITRNGQVFTPEQTQTNSMTTLIFNPEEDTEHYYSIKLVDGSDIENYNNYNFTIKTIKPIINLFGVEPNGKTGGSVYASWEASEEQYTALYTLNGTTQEYRKGQTLTAAGSYTISLSDEIGNTNTVNFTIDKIVEFLIADTNGKTYSIEEIECINFDIRFVEKEPLSATITKDNNPYDYQFGLMIIEEGFYQVALNDEFNNTIFFSFTIDKTPPEAKLYGVENYGVTGKSAWVTSMESNITCWIVKDENLKEDYKIGTEIVASGNYKIFIADKAKNITTFEFKIDKGVAYDINTYHGGISNGGVRIIAYENLKVVMYKDEKPIEYEFEQILNEDGEYSFTLVDDLGNKTSSFFTIITKKKQNLNHILQEDIKVTSITKNEENYEFEITDNKLYLYDEGIYKVNILDEKTDKEYRFSITLDTTPPTLELVGVENGGSTKKRVVMKNVSEKPYTIYITVDGVPFEYKIGDEIEKSGRFIVTLSDEAGNTTTYTFERIYSLNGASIAVLAGLGALVVLLIILLIRSRHHYYKDEVIEEELEETTIEEDMNDNNDENIEN